MATYYVTQNGGAAPADGSDYTHSMSVASHNSGSFNPGDIIYICGTITSRIIPPNSGTSGNPIIYKGDLASHNALIRVTGESQIRFDGIDYLTFDGIFFDGQNGAAEIGLFSCGSSEYITIKNCWFEEQNLKGIAMWHDCRDGRYNGAAPCAACRYWTVGGADGDGNTFYNVGISTAANIMSMWWSNNLVFSYNTIYSDNAPFELGRSGLVIEDSSYVLVEYNNLYNLTNEDGIGGKNAGYVIVRYNTSHDMQGGSGLADSQGHGINMAWSVGPLPCHDWYVYANTSYNNNKTGINVMYGATNINIWSNLIYNNGMVGINLNPGGAGTIKIYNNTIVNSNTESWPNLLAANIHINSASSALIKNNILYSSIQQPQIVVQNTAGVTMDYNHYYYTGGTPTVYWGDTYYNYNALPGTQEDNATTGNPNFTDKYTLTDESPCRDTGVDLSGLVGYLNIQGADGYPGIVNMYWDDGLDPISDFTNIETVEIVKQDAYAPWEKGAFVYTGGLNYPNGTINTPVSDTEIEEGQSVNFTGTAAGGTGPYTYLWDFDGGATNSTDEDPGSTTFNTAGVYTVTFTVTDNIPLADQSPDSVVITVKTESPGGCSETPDSSFIIATDDYEVGAHDGLRYRGGLANTGFSDVCRIDVKLIARNDVSGYTYYAEVFEPDGVNLTFPAKGVSTGVTGDNSWNSWVQFDFPTTVDIAVGDIITVSCHETTGWGDYVEWYGDFTAGATDIKSFGKWDPSGIRSDLWAFDPTIKIYLSDEFIPGVANINCSETSGIYKENETTGYFTVYFDGAVDVDITGGTPDLELETGTINAKVLLTSGSQNNITSITFSGLPVIDGYNSSDLDAIQINLNGGTIKSTGTSTNATLDLPTGASTGSLATNCNIIIDTTSPTAESVNNTDNNTSANGIYSTIDEVVKFAIVFDENNLVLTGFPGYPRIATNVKSENIVYADAIGFGETSDTIIMGFPLTSGMRIDNLDFVGDLDIGPGGTITDQAGNDINTTMSGLSLSLSSNIEIAVPYTSDSPKEFDNTNKLTSWMAAGSYPIENDNFLWTEDSTDTFDISDYDGTVGNPITLNGGGFVLTGNQICGDYYIIKNFKFK